MLSDDVRRCTDLKIVLLVHSGHQVGVIESDAIVGIGPEEERFRWFCSGLHGLDVGPERQDARLREVPAGLVQFDVELERRRFVGAGSSSGGEAFRRP